MKTKMIGTILVVGIIQIAFVQAAHTLHKELKLIASQKSNTYQFFKLDTPLFSRLTFSGKAFCPTKGHLAFSVQARNAHTHRWSRWHRILQWGKKKQTYATKSDGFCKYVHVQLKTEPLQLADAFRIKVVGARKAPITNLKHFSVRIADVMRNE